MIRYIECPLEDLDEKETEFIKQWADAGFQLLNKTGGSQSEGKRVKYLKDASHSKKIAGNQNHAKEKKYQSQRQRERMPNKARFFRLLRVVTEFHFGTNGIFRLPRRPKICLFGVVLATNHIPHNRAVMGMRQATEMGVFFFQLDDGGLNRHGAFDGRQELGCEQKQTDSSKDYPGKEKEQITHGEPLKIGREWRARRRRSPR